MESAAFRMSSFIKDILGRNLVTDEFVAVFELVKNGIDAGATWVHVEIDPEADTISIVDNGKGMDAEGIHERWLFLAYSAKADGSEGGTLSEDYRDRIRNVKNYAGSKGIGRISCDTLGRQLDLYSRAAGGKEIARLTVDWKAFEADAKQELGDVDVSVGEAQSFPDLEGRDVSDSHGTFIHISGLREHWSQDKVRRLRRFLAKLIDPFEASPDAELSTWLVGHEDPPPPRSSDEEAIAKHQALRTNGLVANDIVDILEQKTTRISVTISDGSIETRLVDRGTLMLHTREQNTYAELAGVDVRGEVYFLNRSAKATFKRRMGVPSVEFGSIFLFLNGFRIFPIGEEFDDTLGLNRRKQQGSSRYFGTRDVMGRIDVRAAPGVLREASSRDQGLIEDANSRALFAAINERMVRRLERYVVGVNWKVKVDRDRDDRSALETDPGRALAAGVLGQMVRRKDLEVLHIDPGLFEMADERASSTSMALGELQRLAEAAGREDLLSRVESTRARIAELEEESREADERAREMAEARRQDAALIAALERQARFLSRSADLDVETLTNLIHQATVYATHIDGTSNGLFDPLRRIEQMMPDGHDVDPEDLEDLAAGIRSYLGDTRARLGDIRLEAKRLMALLRVAPAFRTGPDSNVLRGDLPTFLREYFEVMVEGRHQNLEVKLDIPEGLEFEASFSPFDIAVVVDNLLSNARRANASKVEFRLRSVKGGMQIVVSDDGRGIGQADSTKVFERGYTTTEGSGLGLYHVRTVMEARQGKAEVDPRSPEGRLDLVLTFAEMEA